MKILCAPTSFIVFHKITIDRIFLVFLEGMLVLVAVPISPSLRTTESLAAAALTDTALLVKLGAVSSVVVLFCEYHYEAPYLLHLL